MGLAKFHGKVPFPQAEIVSGDPDRRLDTHESNWPTVTTQHRQMCIVASRNRSFSSQLLAHRRDCLDHSTTRIYLRLRITSLSFFFRSIPSSSQPAVPTRTAELERAVLSMAYKLHGRTLGRRNIIRITADHRSAIMTIPYCNWQASSVNNAQLWTYAHIRSREHSGRCATQGVKST